MQTLVYLLPRANVSSTYMYDFCGSQHSPFVFCCIHDVYCTHFSPLLWGIMKQLQILFYLLLEFRKCLADQCPICSGEGKTVITYIGNAQLVWNCGTAWQTCSRICSKIMWENKNSNCTMCLTYFVHWQRMIYMSVSVQWDCFDTSTILQLWSQR